MELGASMPGRSIGNEVCELNTQSSWQKQPLPTAFKRTPLAFHYGFEKSAALTALSGSSSTKLTPSNLRAQTEGPCRALDYSHPPAAAPQLSQARQPRDTEPAGHATFARAAAGPALQHAAGTNLMP